MSWIYDCLTTNVDQEHAEDTVEDANMEIPSTQTVVLF